MDSPDVYVVLDNCTFYIDRNEMMADHTQCTHGIMECVICKGDLQSIKQTHRPIEVPDRHHIGHITASMMT